MPQMLKYFFTGLYLIILLNCSDDNNLSVPEVDCSVVLCTAEFVTITIQVQDKDGAFIPLDEFRVTDAQTGDVINRKYSQQELEEFRRTGTYPLYDDSFRSEHVNKNRSVIFSGFINGSEVVKASYVVFANCCHVGLESGEDIIVLN